MNKELIEILKSIRIWSIRTRKLCRGYTKELRLDDDCDYHCKCCPVVSNTSNELYPNQITSIPLN